MKWPKTQFDVDSEVYLFKTREQDGKIIGRFERPKFGILPLRPIYLEYISGEGSRGGTSFRMSLYDGRNFSEEIVKTEEGSLSRLNKRLNREYEEKVRNLIREAIKLSQTIEKPLKDFTSL